MAWAWRNGAKESGGGAERRRRAPHTYRAGTMISGSAPPALSLSSATAQCYKRWENEVAVDCASNLAASSINGIDSATCSGACKITYMDWFYDCKHTMFATDNTSAVPAKLLEDIGSFFACCSSGVYFTVYFVALSGLTLW